MAWTRPMQRNIDLEKKEKKGENDHYTSTKDSLASLTIQINHIPQ